MAHSRINSEELVPWCERRGVDASLLVAEQPQQWRGSDGIHYRLRLPGEGAHYVDVVAPHDDPMPPIYKMGQRATGAEAMTQEALLDLIEDYAQKAVAASLADALVGRGGPERQDASAAHMAMLDAVRSLPIEAGR